MTQKILLTIFVCIIAVVLYAMGALLIPFLLGSIFAYALHVPVISFAKFFKCSTWISATIFVLLAITLVASFVFFLSPLIKHSVTMIVYKLPDIMSTLPSTINTAIEKVANVFGIQEADFDMTLFIKKCLDPANFDTTKYLSHFVNTGIKIIYTILFVFMTKIITFYMIKDWKSIERYINNFVKKNTSRVWYECMININKNLGMYVTGQLQICLILSVVYTVFLKIIGIETYIICGVISGIMSFVPFVGPFFACLTTVASGLHSDLHIVQYVAIVLLYVVIPFVDSNFITPKLIGGRVGIHPFWILFSICAATSVLGISGVFISVPLAVVVSTICKTVTRQLI